MIKAITRKRGENMSQESTVTIIIVLLVIVVVVLILFRQNIIGWVRSLPGYEPPADNETDISKLSDEEIRNFCPVRLGSYENSKGAGIFGQYYIFLREDGSSRQTDFYLAKERVRSNEYNLIRKARAWADPIAGRIVDKEIVLYADFLRSEISVLNGAWLARGNLICKREEK